MKFSRLVDGGTCEYEVSIVSGNFPQDIKEGEHGAFIVQCVDAPKKYDIVLDDGERLVVVWTNADDMIGAYLVRYAAWPYDWKQWIPR